MCYHPIEIPNPYRGLKPKPGSIQALHDCTSAYITVPCGHCPQCIAVKQMYYVQRVQMESLENHLFFATLTYNQESLPRLAVSSGYDIPYADVRDLQNCFKRIEKYNLFTRPFRWFAVSERGSERGRPHFHVLFSIPKYEGDTYFDCINLEKIMFDALLHEWRRNVAPMVYSSRSGKYIPDVFHPVYRPLCTYYRRFVCGKLSSNYDLHYVESSLTDEGLASVAFYVLKYMLKPSSKETRLQQALRLNLPEDEYDSVWPIVKSSRYVSHYYGDNASALCHIVLGINEGLKNSQYNFPVFFNPDSGQTFPLAPYYKHDLRYFSFDKRLDFYYRQKTPYIDSINLIDYKPRSQFYKAVRDYEKVLDKTRLDFLDSLDDPE